MKAEFSGDGHFRDAELCNSVTATDGRARRRVDHCAAAGLPDCAAASLPDVPHVVKVLALDRLQRHKDDHCDVLVCVAQCYEDSLPLTGPEITKNNNFCLDNSLCEPRT